MKRTFDSRVPVSVLMPIELQKVVAARAQREDLTFSQIVRRAVRKELGIRDGDDLHVSLTDRQRVSA